MGKAKEIAMESEFYCDECHTFNGTEDECIKDSDGDLHCPICDNIIGHETLPSYARNTGLTFQDYVDYLNEKDIIEHTLNQTISILEMNNELSFDKFNSKDPKHIDEVLNKDISDYFDVEKQTSKQRNTINELLLQIKELYPNENVFNVASIKKLNDYQSSELIRQLLMKLKMKEVATARQINYLKKLEDEFKHYYFFDDKLNVDICDFIDKNIFVSRFEASERIGVMSAIREYEKEITDDIIPETYILYDAIEDKVKNWKGIDENAKSE
ncbi:hypothetical protein ACR56S_04130 [Staphylococcus hominis]|uniref:hypothetical protein n=1 Tax=Staphylococcus hominis TaxID=1290 RepID=UPI003DA147B2